MSIFLICIDAHTHIFVSQTHIFHFGKNFVHRDDISLFTTLTHTPTLPHTTHRKERLLSLPLRPPLLLNHFYPHACTSVVPVLYTSLFLFNVPTPHSASIPHAHTHTLSHTHTPFLIFDTKQTDKEKEPECVRVLEKERQKACHYFSYRLHRLSGIKNKHRVKERNVVPGIDPGIRGTHPGTSCDARQLTFFVQDHGVTGWDGRDHCSQLCCPQTHSSFFFCSSAGSTDQTGFVILRISFPGPSVSPLPLHAEKPRQHRFQWKLFLVRTTTATPKKKKSPHYICSRWTNGPEFVAC